VCPGKPCLGWNSTVVFVAGASAPPWFLTVAVSTVRCELVSQYAALVSTGSKSGVDPPQTRRTVEMYISRRSPNTIRKCIVHLHSSKDHKTRVPSTGPHPSNWRWLPYVL